MNILILGSLPKDDQRMRLYERMISACEGHSVSSPVDTANFNGSKEERYERAFAKVKEADLIIGEQSTPSTGQGMEIREAANLGKPLIVVARKGSKISGLIKGCPILQDIIYYESADDLFLKLRVAIS